MSNVVRLLTHPPLAGKRPKLMLRAWDRWRAGEPDYPADLALLADFVRLSIRELILNHGFEAEPSSQRNLDARLAKFEKALQAHRRG